MPTAGRRLELVKGKVYEMPPAGGRHGSVAMRIGFVLTGYVRAHNLGETFAAETGFILHRDPDTVRAPDAAFVAAGRFPEGELPTGYLDVVPDLVVEVTSPNDRAREISDKVEGWLAAGVRLVWVINPATRSAAVYRSLEDSERLSPEDSLDGGDVIPGFSTELRELFS